MKVALINYFHPFSGIGKYPFNLLHFYRKERKKVDMIYFESRHNKIPDQHGVIKIKRDTPSIELNKSILPYFYFPKKIPDGYDVYHATNQYLSRVTLYKRPCVITHHDIRPIAFPHDIKMRAIGIILKQLLKFYRKTDKIIAITNEAKEALLKMKIVPEEKIKVIYHGYNAEIYKPIKKSTARGKLGLPQDAKIVLHVGTEDPMRRVSLILETMKEMQKIDPNVLFIRVGGSVFSGGYWKTKEQLKRQINMKQFKNVPEEEMPLIYNSADLFLAPQVYDEGFFYPAVEAMACGTPIATSNMKIFEQWGMVIPNDPKELAEMILKTLNNKSLRNKLSKKALKGAKNFSMKKEAKSTYAVYEEVCKK